MSIPTSDVPSGLANQAPLSDTQNFLCMFDQGDGGGPFGPRYNIVVGWRLRGRVDVETLRQAMADVVARHDSLRASIVTVDGVKVQRIHPPSPPELVVRDLPPDSRVSRAIRAEELLGMVEAGTYSVDELPHLRAVLGRFDDQDAVLALIAHHTASDGWSMQLIMRDIAACYAVRRGYVSAVPPPARTYQEYATWQRDGSGDRDTTRSKRYWRDKLEDAEILGVPTDHPRSAGLEKVSPVHRFSIAPEVTSAALELAKAMRSSPFMILFAVYNLVLHRTTGATDLVVPTLASGRTEPEYQDTVGPFFNFVPLRTDVRAAATFRDLAERCRTTCIEAMSHEIAFVDVLAEAPALMSPMADDRLAACAFQVWQFFSVMDREVVGDVEYTEVRGRMLPQAQGTDIPDGALLTLDIDPSGEIFGNLAYNSNLYAEGTMRVMAAEYCRLLEGAVAAPDSPLESL